MNINAPADNFVLPGMRARTSDPNIPREKRLPGLRWIPNKIRNHFIAWLGELVGTFLFLFFAFAGTQVANAAASEASKANGTVTNAPNTANLLYIALAFGFSLAVNAWVFFRISGGLFNPAVTLGMCLIGAVGWVRGAIVFTAQIVGAIASAALVSGLFAGPLNVRTSLNPGTSIVRGLFIEMFLTFMLIFTIFMLAAEKHKGTFLAPIGIGLSLFIAELAGGYFSGGSLNPARSFGPDVVLGTFFGYHWIYWLGPALGSILAVIFYRLIKILEYETANPGQDFNDKEAEVFNPDEDPAGAQDVRPPNVEVGRSEYIADDRGIHLSPNRPMKELHNSRFQSMSQPLSHSTSNPHRSRRSKDGPGSRSSYTGGRGRNDGTDEHPVQDSYAYSTDGAQRSPRRSGERYAEKRERRSSRSSAGGYVSSDLMLDSARAAYPAGYQSANGATRHSHFPHDRSYYQGPAAENGSVQPEYGTRF